MRKFIVSALASVALLTAVSAANAGYWVPGPVFVPPPIYMPGPVCVPTIYGPVCGYY